LVTNVNCVIYMELEICMQVRNIQRETHHTLRERERSTLRKRITH